MLNRNTLWSIGKEELVNKSKIDWCDHTWNPITGCKHGCKYCYARKNISRFSGDVRRNKMARDNYCTMKAADGESDLYILDKPMKNETGSILVYPFGFEPTFHRYRMERMDDLKAGRNIFVGAMADMFGEWVPDAWIKEIFGYCLSNPIHNYLFLTKNPKRYQELENAGLLPDRNNMWYGFSYTNNLCEWILSGSGGRHRFVSIEPLMEDLRLFDADNPCCAVQWVIIGAETGNRRGKVVPEPVWIEKIVKHCEKFQIPVFMKSSLIPIVGEQNMRREFPPELLRKEISRKMEAKLYDTCCICGIKEKKNSMIALSARRKRGESTKTFCYMCGRCLNNFCIEHNIDTPQLENMEDKQNG